MPDFVLDTAALADAIDRDPLTIVGVLPDGNGFGRPDIFMAKRIVER